jgi:hypothetical protein
MKTINVKPVQIIGACPAALTLADEFQIEGLRLNNPRQSTICFLAVSQLPIGQGIWQIQGEERFFSHVSCPGCTVALEQEKRVVFLLGHADKWELSQIISEYLRLSQHRQEPEAARRARDEAIQHQNRGEYAEATAKMASALRELKRSSL